MFLEYVKKNTFLPCILLLVSYTFLYFRTIPVLGLTLFCSSLFLGIYLIKKENKNLLINNASLFFLLCLFSYGFYNPFVAYLSNNMSLATYRAMLIYASAIPAYLVGLQLCKLQVSHGEQWKVTSDNCTVSIFLLILFLLIAYKSYLFYSLDLFFNPLNLQGKSRDYIFGNMTQLDAVVGLVITGIFLFFIYQYKNIPKYMLVGLSVLLTYYILLNLMAGNRRDFIPMLLGLFYIIVSRYNIKFKWIYIIVFFVGSSLFNILGGVRTALSSGNKINKNILISSLKNNEFTIPFNTLADEVGLYESNPSEYEFKKGKTYIKNTFEIFIPRKLFPNKFTSLAKEYMVKFHNTTNYAIAYTPVTESFVNFGRLGSVLVYFFLGYFLAFNIKNQIFIFIFFCLVIDFCRSEFSGFVFNYMVTSVPFLFNSLINIKTK